MIAPAIEYQDKSGLWLREYFPPAPCIALKGRFKVMVIDRQTKAVVHERPWQRNLILDQGLDYIGTKKICDCFLYCAAGTGNTPTEADSTGNAQASQSGTTVTLSAGWAEVAIGRLIRWDTGEEAKITAGSGTSWTVDRSQTVANGDFRVFRVNQTGLTTEVTSPAGAGRTNTYLTGSGNSETTRSGSTFIHRRTYDFLSPSGSTNYAEVGVSDVVTQTTNLFSRILIAGGAVTVTTSQQLRVIYELRVTVSPTTPNSKSAGITGWPVSPATDQNGTEQLDSGAVTSVNIANGLTTFFNGLVGVGEPYGGVGGFQVFLSSSSAAHGTWPTSVDRSLNAAQVSIDTSTYTNGQFLKDRGGEFAANAGNRTDWRGVGIGEASPNATFPWEVSRKGIYFLFGQAQTKANTHKLRLTFRYTWNRDLS